MNGRQAIGAVVLVSLLLVVTGGRAQPAGAGQTFTVNTAEDACDPDASGCLSLRVAIQLANQTADADVINFDIGPEPGPKAIELASPLPCIIEPLTIDGTSQPKATPPDASNAPMIEVDAPPVPAEQPCGSGLTPFAGSGFTVFADHVRIQGLVINGFGRAAIELAAGVIDGVDHISGDGVIVGNYVGTEGSGAHAAATQNGVGVRIDSGSVANQIGGSTPAERNVISNSKADGMDIDSSGNVVSGNYIGTNAAGTVAIPNGGYGVSISSGESNQIGGAADGERNVISGNALDGVVIGSSGNRVYGNYIGTTASGDSAIPNNFDGVSVESGAFADIGGSETGQGNVISGNGRYGIKVPPTNGHVFGNYVGTNAAGTDAVSNGADGIVVEKDVVVESPSGTALTPSAAADAVQIGGPGAGERNVISGNEGSGIVIVTGTAKILGNFIGTNAAGTDAVPNGANGVTIPPGADSNDVGGFDPGQGNVISGNARDGVYVGSGPNSVVGNHVGTDAGGSAAVANGEDGIVVDTQPAAGISSGPALGPSAAASAMDRPGIAVTSAAAASADAVQVGGSAAGRNVVSGNHDSGVRILSGAAEISGNFIGTNVSGTDALPNGQDGVTITINGSALVGGAGADERNVISGNDRAGITIASPSNEIYGNYIGTTASGTGAVPNGAYGVVTFGGADANEIGGPVSGQGNVISGNSGSGIALASAANGVYGNFVGTDAAGTRAVPNGGDGLMIVGVFNPNSTTFVSANFNQIGDVDNGFGNVIRFNARSGVTVSGSAEANSIRGNSISSNQALGIDLGGDGVTPNDVADADSGPNALQNFPELTGFSSECVSAPVVCSTSIDGTLSSAPTSLFLIDVYSNAECDPSGSGEGATFLGSVETRTDSGGNASFSFPLPADLRPEAMLTATATEEEPVPSFSDATPGFFPTSTSEHSSCRARSADIAVAKTVDRSSATIGDGLTYTITVANRGPDVAQAVVLSDPLPAALAVASATSSRGSCSGANAITCDLGTLPDGDSVQITIKGTVAAVGTLTNTATTSAPTPDPDRSNNSDSAATVVTSADLSLTKTDVPDPVNVGDPLVYTLTVRNAGPSTADAVSLTDTLDGNTSIVSATSSRGTCSGQTVLVCELGSMGAAAQATVVVRVRPNAAGTVTNRAVVTSATSDPEPANNNATAITEAASADLSLTKTDTPDPVNVGDQLVYTLTIRNTGPSTAAAVRLTDRLDPTVTFASATPTQGTCSFASALVCELGSMPASAQATVVVRVTPRAAGSLANAATVTSSTVDPNPADNSAALTTEVTSADLSIEKVDAPDPITVGGTLVYRLSVSNAGPSPAVGVRVTDTIAATASFVSAASGSRACTGRSAVVCELGTLAAGERATIEIEVTPRSAGRLANVAQVASTTYDPISDNNSALASTRVTSADLSTIVVAAPRRAKVGQLVTFTVQVKNRGPTAASNAVATLAVPDGAAIARGRRCARGPTVRCRLGTVGAGKKVVVTITVRPKRAGRLVTIARVAGADFDPANGNNADSATATARFLPRVRLSPPIGPPGFVTFVIGQGFPPSTVIALRWFPGLGGAAVRTSSSGGLRVPLLVFPNDVIGPRVVIASGTTSDPGLRFTPVQARFLVVPGRSLPAGFVERR